MSKQYQNLVLFAPELIKGNKIVTQTLAFSVPYRATNLLYMTSPQIRYIIIGNSNTANEVNESIPSDLKKEIYQTEPQIKNSNNYKVRFVVFGDMVDFPKALEKLPDTDVTAVRINGDSEKGLVEFLGKDGDSWMPKGKSFYLGKQTLMGSIYSDTLENYECNMRNVFFKLRLVSKIYDERTKILLQQSIAAGQSECTGIYNNALTQLNRIFAASSNFNERNVNEIAGAAMALSEENKNAQIYSCTMLY